MRGGREMNSLLIINEADDELIFYSNRFRTTTFLDLAFTTENIAHKTEGEILGQVGGSDRKPVKLKVFLSYIM